MTIRLGLLVLGSLLVYAGWKNLSVQALLFGDNTTPKSPVSSSTGGQGSGGSSNSQGSGVGASSAPVINSSPYGPQAPTGISGSSIAGSTRLTK